MPFIDNVEICATILSDKPPQLPLREELPSLGFEVIYHAQGIGVKAAKHNSKKAVHRYRKRNTVKDLRKRRFFPKSSKRIKEILAERKLMEHELKLPHAFSYETYTVEMQHHCGDTISSSSIASSLTEFSMSPDGIRRTKRIKKRWGMFQRRKRTTRVQSDDRPPVDFVRAEFPPISFPELLAPDDDGSFRTHISDGAPLLQKCVQVDNDNNPFKDVPDSSHKEGSNDLDEQVFASVEDEVYAAFSGDSDLGRKEERPDRSNHPFDEIPDEIYTKAGMGVVVSDQKAVPPSGTERDSDGKKNPEEMIREATLEYKNAFAKVAAEVYVSFDSDVRDTAALATKKEARRKLKAGVKEEQAGESPQKPVSQNAFDGTREKVYQAGGVERQNVSFFDSDVRDTAALAVQNAKTNEELGDIFIELCKSSVTDTQALEKGNEGKEKGRSRRNWMSSARHALRSCRNVTTDMLMATCVEKQGSKEVQQMDSAAQAILQVDSNEQPPVPQGKKSAADIGELFADLKRIDSPNDEIYSILKLSPELVQVRRLEDGRMPLHALCDRGMPDRSSVSPDSLTEYLLRDIGSYKRLVALIHGLYPNASVVKDRKGDLPVHLIARRFMIWEANWYEKVYENAARQKTSTADAAAAITKLYHSMSETVEKLLQPIVSSRSLCQAPGSVGVLLPLHIASIFTVSVSTLRLILETYPEAAAVSCDTGVLQSLVPNGSLPMELHEKLSTDFPKWEVKAHMGAQPSISPDTSEKLDECIRRSDLLFAYHPIEPYRFEKERIRRIESCIEAHAKRVAEKRSAKLDHATELLWIWMCTFREPGSKRPTYVNSVKRIANDVPLVSLRHLANLKTGDGRPVINAASLECRKVIQRRLGKEIMTTKSKSSTPVAASISKEKLFGEGFVARLCRLIFNVQKMPFPTSFVVLPYQLKKTEDGSLKILSPESSKAAMQFAECVLNLTAPRSILYCLDEKSTEYYGQSIYDSTADEAFHLDACANMKSCEDSLLSLFESGNGYLYLIDEDTGQPQVPTESGIYPIIIHEATDSVRDLLPLMMMGMVQMRGEKAVSMLAAVLLNERVASVPPSWVDAAKELSAYLDWKQENEPDPSTGHLRHYLSRFKSTSSSRLRTAAQSKNRKSEWSKELSILRKLIETHDPERMFEVSAKMGDIDVGVGELSKKLDALSKIFCSVHKAHSSANTSAALPSSPGDTESPIGDSIYVTRAPKQSRKAVAKKIRPTSGYSALFEGLAMEEPGIKQETREPAESGLCVWNAGERAWEDVTSQLNRSEPLCEDPQILQLKVALAEQAEKLARLGKKVTKIKDDEKRLASAEDKIYELLHDPVSPSGRIPRSGLTNARKLVLRMCDLEERLVCDEIQIQHLAFETISLDHEKERMAAFFEDTSNKRIWVETGSASERSDESIGGEIPKRVNVIDVAPLPRDSARPPLSRSRLGHPSRRSPIAVETSRSIGSERYPLNLVAFDASSRVTTPYDSGGSYATPPYSVRPYPKRTSSLTDSGRSFIRYRSRHSVLFTGDSSSSFVTYGEPHPATARTREDPEMIDVSSFDKESPPRQERPSTNANQFSPTSVRDPWFFNTQITASPPGTQAKAGGSSSPSSEYSLATADRSDESPLAPASGTPRAVKSAALRDAEDLFLSAMRANQSCNTGGRNSVSPKHPPTKTVRIHEMSGDGRIEAARVFDAKHDEVNSKRSVAEDSRDPCAINVTDYELAEKKPSQPKKSPAVSRTKEESSRRRVDVIDLSDAEETVTIDTTPSKFSTDPDGSDFTSAGTGSEPDGLYQTLARDSEPDDLAPWSEEESSGNESDDEAPIAAEWIRFDSAKGHLEL